LRKSKAKNGNGNGEDDDDDGGRKTMKGKILKNHLTNESKSNFESR